MSYRFATVVAVLAIVTLAARPAAAGPYLDAEDGVPGFVGSDPDGSRTAGNALNPIFKGWATTVVDYSPTADAVAPHNVATNALGAVDKTTNSIVSLGELTGAELDAGATPGSITLGFGVTIADGAGADFAVFENAFILFGTTAVFGELAFVEVSTDGTHFARFESDSQHTTLEDPFASPAFTGFDATGVNGLAGKTVNDEFGQLSFGTPFDLADLAGVQEVIDGLVDLNDINFIRFVDIPGRGDFTDTSGDPILDAWETDQSGGFDLDAVGVINTATVPEPASATLIAIGALLLTRRRR